jgi:succinate-acetate transporter protein
VWVFNNCMGVLVICVLVFTVLCFVCTVFLYRFVYVYLFLFVLSVLLLPSDNSTAVNNNNHNNNYCVSVFVTASRHFTSVVNFKEVVVSKWRSC